VIEYIDRPEEALRSIRGWLAPGGLLSLRHLNRYSNMYQPAMHENDLATAARHAQQPTMTSSFGMEMRSCGPDLEQIADMRHAVGFAHADRHGIMPACANYIPGDHIKQRPGLLPRPESPGDQPRPAVPVLPHRPNRLVPRDAELTHPTET
jgi:hypothetical protein